MRGPRGCLGGEVFDALVTYLDLYPTICDVDGIPHSRWLQGRLLMPLVRDDTDSLHATAAAIGAR